MKYNTGAQIDKIIILRPWEVTTNVWKRMCNTKEMATRMYSAPAAVHLSKPHGYRCLISRRRTAVTPSRLHRNSLLSFPPAFLTPTLLPAFKSQLWLRRAGDQSWGQRQGGWTKQRAVRERERRRRKGKAPMDEQAAPARQTLSSWCESPAVCKAEDRVNAHLVERLELSWMSWIGWLLWLDWESW